MSLQIYCGKNFDTQKAERFFKERRIPYQRIDTLKYGIGRRELETIAAATGLTEGQVNSMIDQLDISSWSVVALPDDAVATGSFETTYQGAAATVTTYRDPSYVTVSALGQDLTFAVPASAQGYVGYLAYL